MDIKSWVHAARLRTLPLSLSGIILGSAIAFKQDFLDMDIFILAISTTLFLQILSNFANDLGDSYKGADNENRVGPVRAIQSGEISQKQMIIGVVILVLLSLITAIPLIIIGTNSMPSGILWLYIVLAFLCILAAITYTVGKKAYGYYGLGDLMVFIFFGLVSVLGVYSLYSKQFSWFIVLPAVAIGFLSIGVLNLNNMRDSENDKKVGKNTIAVSLGFHKAKVYQTLLIVVAFLSLLVFIFLEWNSNILPLFPFILLGLHLKKMWKTKEPKALDSELKVVSLSTLFIALLFLFSSLP